MEEMINSFYNTNSSRTETSWSWTCLQYVSTQFCAIHWWVL
jgi:hypothetical protein